MWLYFGEEVGNLYNNDFSEYNYKYSELKLYSSINASLFSVIVNDS